MSRVKIERALMAKGLRWSELRYDRQPTPHGMMPGWTIVLEDDVDEELAATGFDTEPDAEVTQDVLDWIETLPNLQHLAASPHPTEEPSP